MNPPKYPAAYLRTRSRSGELTMRRAAAERRWPDPDLYVDGADGPFPALEDLTAAIAAGRHDALLLAIPPTGDPAILRLLSACTAQGVTVSFVPHEVHDADPAQQRVPDSTVPAGPQTAAPVTTLMRARLDALSDLFPEWRIWVDGHGWHARRRNGYMQLFRTGVPAFHVRADNATELAAQLCWQQAADAHFPQGCARGKLAEEAGLTPRVAVR